MARTPWGDCKVAFDYNGDDEILWTASENGEVHLPKGWSLNETDAAGARLVAVFRVEGAPPTVHDGKLVRALLAKLARRRRS